MDDAKLARDQRPLMPISALPGLPPRSSPLRSIAGCAVTFTVVFTVIFTGDRR
jgi:hypothetical protein